MWSFNLYTDQKSADVAKRLPYMARPDRRIRAYWHARYVRMSRKRMAHIMRPQFSHMRMRLRKARGYYAHAARRAAAGLPQPNVHPYVRLSLLTDYCL